MNIYISSKIYTLIDRKDNSLRYVGITIQNLNQRFDKHIHDYKRGRML